LTSPNVCDSNGEPANLVDVFDSLTDAIRRGFDELTFGDRRSGSGVGAIEGHTMHMEDAIKHHGESINSGLESIASAIGDLAAAIRERK
jgi:hypothetical protein